MMRLFSFTPTDLARLRRRCAQDDALAAAGRRFLCETGEGSVVDDLTIDELIEVGAKAADPERLLAGPNLLAWANMVRNRPPLARRFTTPQEG